MEPEGHEVEAGSQKLQWKMGQDGAKDLGNKMMITNTFRWDKDSPKLLLSLKQITAQ